MFKPLSFAERVWLIVVIFGALLLLVPLFLPLL